MKQLKLGTKLLIGGLLTVAIPVIVIGDNGGNRNRFGIIRDGRVITIRD